MTGGPGIERNLGEQPLAAIMARHGLKAHDLLAALPEPMTHKMVARACKGRRLTPWSQARVVRALNAAAETEYTLCELFNY